MEEITITCNGTCEVCICKSHTQSCHTELAKVFPKSRLTLEQSSSQLYNLC